MEKLSILELNAFKEFAQKQEDFWLAVTNEEPPDENPNNTRDAWISYTYYSNIVSLIEDEIHNRMRRMFGLDPVYGR